VVEGYQDCEYIQPVDEMQAVMDHTMSDSTQMAGKVVSLWRYPIKSMLGEDLKATLIANGSLLGDRVFALIDSETGKVVSAKNPCRWPHLFEFRDRKSTRLNSSHRL